MEANMRMTKIVVTLGPSTDDREVLRNIMLAGANVVRVNFSHGTHEEQLARISVVKELRTELDLPVALLADTRGPEVRVGLFSEKKVYLTAGERFTLTTTQCDGDAHRVSVSYSGLPSDVKSGTRILLDDGLIELKVDSVTDTEIHTTIINGGFISSRKGVNVPSVRLGLPFISSKDRADLRFIAENDFDFIAASFTQSAENINQLREELHRLNADNIRIIAKIENAEGISNIESILNVSNGIMVARGDMGVEVAMEELPIIQKNLIRGAYQPGKHVITATQMLDSMMNNPRPTRAEVSDVANAIYDGSSAIMLSGETAAGKYPLEAVKTMARIAERAERDIDYHERFLQQKNIKETQ
ncbi:pyruvate kinase [Holotrichia oblita]|nr:pyruvate kinase [Holotrichia oblita]